MAKVPLPDRGQPLDVTYIYQLANAINDVADTVSTATSKYATIDTRQIGKETFKIPDIRIYAGYVDVATAQTVTATQVLDSKPQDFGISFKYPPIVIASLVNNNTQTAGNSATVIVSSVSTTSVSFRVRFDTAGEASVGVNFLAVGVPSWYNFSHYVKM